MEFIKKADGGIIVQGHPYASDMTKDGSFLSFIIYSYGYILPRYIPHTPAQFADIIGGVYHLGNPVNRKVVEYLRQL